MFSETYHNMNKQISPDKDLINNVIHSINKVQSNKRNSKLIFRKPVVVVSIILVVFLSTMPVAIANVPTVYELMYLVSPSIAQYFIPVEKSCEHNGIMMEVVSTYIYDDTAEIYITLQDLVGNRIDNTTDLNDSYSIHRPFDSSATCERVGYDDSTKKATFLISITEWGNNVIVGEKITFSIREFISNKLEYNDMLLNINLSDTSNSSLTMQTTNVTGGSGINYSRYAINNSESITVLTPSEKIDFGIDGIEISGIGYVDGMLHIQTAVVNNLTKDNHGYFFVKDKIGNKIQCDYNVSFVDNFNCENRVDYNEYVFDISKKELDEYLLYGTFKTGGLFTEGNWKVTIPIEESEFSY